MLLVLSSRFSLVVACCNLHSLLISANIHFSSFIINSKQVRSYHLKRFLKIYFFIFCIFLFPFFIHKGIINIKKILFLTIFFFSFPSLLNFFSLHLLLRVREAFFLRRDKDFIFGVLSKKPPQFGYSFPSISLISISRYLFS